jgi:hypothetical protein
MKVKSWKPAVETTHLNDPDSLGPYLHLAHVQEQVGKISRAMIVNAHKHNFVPIADMKIDVAQAHAALDEFLASYARAYNGNTGPQAH